MFSPAMAATWPLTVLCSKLPRHAADTFSLLDSREDKKATQTLQRVKQRIKNRGIKKFKSGRHRTVTTEGAERVESSLMATQTKRAASRHSTPVSSVWKKNRFREEGMKDGGCLKDLGNRYISNRRGKVAGWEEAT
ncbi:hypothetical protein BCR44DRAFT_1002480 [Catenaria anguillulae PL171]|uniref:Uncharacterized protein n=1 Tax=Catenaria anguillulae PL171 TaxID=765915 RepID=A0A1Y2I4Q3_9FUNG|nr:hypothetical protein BCR44DRAFT_1002480 [Catenaria anguillulae PL171]